MRHTRLIELYIDHLRALEKAHQQFGGPQGLLRVAAQSVADAGSDHDGPSANESGDDEVASLRSFGTAAGIMMDARIAEELLKANPMRGGKEHRVALLPSEGRVVKVADVQELATESLFDYLTDLLFSNYYFGDDVRILGCFATTSRLSVAITQPYVSGTHPDWPELRRGLLQMGLRDPDPRSEMGAFFIADPILGDVDVYDLHPNNVILDASGRVNPIDAHFYFADRVARLKALRTLGLDQITGLSPLAESLMNPS